MRHTFVGWRKGAVLILAVTLLLLTCPAMAKSVSCRVTRPCKIFQKASKGSKVIAQAQKGDTLNVTGMGGAWARVESSGNVGFMDKTALAKTGAANKEKKTLRQVQLRLSSKGYMPASAVTGKSNAATAKAVRVFQMMNGLKINGKPNKATVAKIMSSSAHRMPKVSGAAWSQSGIDSALHTRGIATIIDMATGARMRIRRVGGHNHLDVEPKARYDTSVLKKVYGGAWSWDSRPVLLIAGGRCFAAAMNGMPHGAEISKSNGFEGQFCVHLRGSLTHGTEKVNSQHQSNISKVVEYFN